VAKMRIKKGDTVVVIAGKDKGKKGKVLSVFPKKERLIVENINMATKHVRPTRQIQQGGIIHQEAPIHISNVMLLCKKCNKPTRIGMKMLDDGTKVRVCKKCGEDIDK